MQTHGEVDVDLIFDYWKAEARNIKNFEFGSANATRPRSIMQASTLCNVREHPLGGKGD